VRDAEGRTADALAGGDRQGASEEFAGKLRQHMGEMAFSRVRSAGTDGIDPLGKAVRLSREGTCVGILEKITDEGCS
jgi:hypothetical protein